MPKIYTDSPVGSLTESERDELLRLLGKCGHEVCKGKEKTSAAQNAKKVWYVEYKDKQ